MTEDFVVRLAVWLVERSGGGPVAEALAGDLLESFADGQSRWWCAGQALRRVAGVAEQRVRGFLAPAVYCAAFVLLHPLWQRWNMHFGRRFEANALTRGAWPGTAVVEIVAGLAPAVVFVWMGVVAFLLLRPRMLRRLDPMRGLLALSFGSCVVSGETMLRLGAFRHELRSLARADFFYPSSHVRFSVPLFFALLAAVALLPRHREDGSRRYARLQPRRFSWLSVVRGLGMMALLVPGIAAQAPVGGVSSDTPRLMAADGKPLEFDVVSVKPNRSGAAAMNIISPPMSDGVTVTNMPVENLVHWAFGIFLSDEIVGLPEWARQERFDVAAKVSEADVAAFRKVSDPVQRAPMLQKILVDRFGLKFHYEMKELSVYALVVGKSGVRMTEIQPAIGPNGMKEGGGREMGRGMIRSMGQPMKPLVNALTMELKRPVVDRTGLAGYYDYTLRWSPEDGVAEDASGPSIFTAVQEQLGLKLEPAKAEVRVLVVDGLERPGAN